jgi:REP element-mobilizing transposase RayT
MPSTHLSLHYHLIFSTKNRIPYIDPAWRARFHAWIGGAIRAAEGEPEAVGGVADHVHILIGLKATHRLSDAVRDIKASSSRWVHQEIEMQDFAWQDGYGAFTVSASLLSAVKEYIAGQELRHQKRTFQEEYLEFLKQSGVAFDEKYIW